MAKKLQQFLDNAAQLNNGTGAWPIVKRETGKIIGCILLKQLPDNNSNLTQDYEIGWHLKRDNWGQGYATEAAKEVLKYGFNVLNLPVIYAVVNPKNYASIKVTQRLGMTPLGRSNKYYNQEVELFQIRLNSSKLLE
jgi:RimJ/RimL family protein N-acetyltransferase